MDSEQVISCIMSDHQLPQHIAQILVSEDGTVDNRKLEAVLMGVAWGKAPASTAAPGLVGALSKAYWENHDRRDAAACNRLKAAIEKIGGQLEPRKT
jgi:hypothetical protein